MARSHFVVALATALTTLVIISQLISSLGFPTVDFWHWRGEQLLHDGTEQTHMYGAKQSGDVVDDPSQYLIGVGKADITGCVATATGCGRSHDR
jgi:neutral ceramidase